MSTAALKLEDLVGCEPMVSGYVRLRSGKVAHQREYLPLLLPLIGEVQRLSEFARRARHCPACDADHETAHVIVVKGDEQPCPLFTRQGKWRSG